MVDLAANEARLNITWGGNNGDMVDPVLVDSSETDIKNWAAEAVRNGSVPGITADQNVDFSDFVLDRFAPTNERPYHLLMLRPKSPFGVI